MDYFIYNYLDSYDCSKVVNTAYSFKIFLAKKKYKAKGKKYVITIEQLAMLIKSVKLWNKKYYYLNTKTLKRLYLLKARIENEEKIRI